MEKIGTISSKSNSKYLSALKTISTRLIALGLIKCSVYEIDNLDDLYRIRDTLYSDPEFIGLDTRGNRMYSVAFNHYCKFATGEGLLKIQPEERMNIFDHPVQCKEATTTVQHSWNRSSIVRSQSVMLAGYTCEMNKEHLTFTVEKTKQQYMEGHHAMPMQQQSAFSLSLDIPANIVCLCPICHRRIHYGLLDDREDMARQIYTSRKERLAASGIMLSQDEFVKIAISRH